MKQNNETDDSMLKGKKDEMSGKRYLSQCNEENLLQKYLFYF
jgi:hypothetical protein